MLMKNRGFTLLELMMTLVVLTVLLVWAIPSFNNSIRNNRLTTKTNEFITALSLARSEAIRRGTQVDVNPIGGAWNNGWEVALANGTVLRTFEPVKGNLTITGDAGNFQFGALGMPTDLSVKTFNICDDGDFGRQVRTTASGRPSIENRDPC